MDLQKEKRKKSCKSTCALEVPKVHANLRKTKENH